MWNISICFPCAVFYFACSATFKLYEHICKVTVIVIGLWTQTTEPLNSITPQPTLTPMLIKRTVTLRVPVSTHTSSPKFTHQTQPRFHVLKHAIPNLSSSSMSRCREGISLSLLGIP